MTKNHIGKTVYIATSQPATNDAAGFEALTYVQVAGVQQAPQFGTTHAMIAVDDLQKGRVENIKGSGSGVSTQMTCRKVDGDTGQGNVETTAVDADGVCAIKIGYGTGADEALVSGDPVEYAQGVLHSYADMQATTTNYEGFTVTFQQNADTVKATEPV